MKKLRSWRIKVWIICMIVFLYGRCVHAATPKLSATSVSICIGYDKTLKISNVSGKKVTWKTSDKNIVSVKKKSNTEVLLQAGKKRGTATVTATVGRKSYKCRVTVKTWYCNTSSGTCIEEGENIRIRSEQVSLTGFASSNKKVAVVSKTGKVVGKKKGTCEIYFYAGRYRYKLKIIVCAKGKKKVVAPKMYICTWNFRTGGDSEYMKICLDEGKTGFLEIKNNDAGIYNTYCFWVNGAYLTQDLKITSSNEKVLAYKERDRHYYCFYSLQDGTTILSISYQKFTYKVKVVISDTRSARYEQMRNEIYRSLKISKTTNRQYACYQLAAWICDHTVYAYNYTKASVGINGSYKDYFNHKTVVCSGYADLFMYLCAGIGIPCRQVTSAAMNHRWNQVFIEGGWYNVDVCWMDTATDGKYSFQYFLVSDNAMIKYSSGSHIAADRNQATATRFDGCCEEQLRLQNEQLGKDYSVLYAGYSGNSPWMTGTWKNY